MTHDKRNQTDELMDALNGVRKEYLEEADHLRRSGKKAQGRKRTMILLTAAAVLALGIGFSIFFIIRNHTKKPVVAANPEETETAASDQTGDTELCSSEDTVPALPLESPEDPSEVFSELPLYHYSGDDPVRAAVTEYVMDYYRENYEKDMLATGDYGESIAVVSLPAFCIHKIKEQDDGRIKVYASFWGFTYRLQDRTLVTLFGGEYPGAGVVTLRKSEDADEWIVEDFERNEGMGETYIDDILRFCEGDEELKEMYLGNDSATDPVRSERITALRQYVRANDLPIDTFRDPGWEQAYIFQPTIEYEEPSEKESDARSGVHPPYRYTGGDPVTAAVLGYVMDHYLETISQDTDCSIVVPAVAFLKSADLGGGRIKVYTDIWTYGYNLYVSRLTTVSFAELPGPCVITLRETAGGTYEVESFVTAWPGYEHINEIEAQYAEDPEVWEIYSSIRAQGGYSDPVFSGRVQYLREYVRENQLPAEYFVDPGWTPVYFMNDPVEKPERDPEAQTMEESVSGGF